MIEKTNQTSTNITNKAAKKVSLKKVLKGLVAKDILDEIKKKKIKVSGITNDSRKVKTGYLFLAYPGASADGRNFVQQAKANGAKFICAEAENSKLIESDTLLQISNLAAKISQMAGKFYGTPTNKMKVAGITGTNGKTSIAYLVAQVLNFLNKPCLLLSTLGNGDLNNLTSAVNTTPDPIVIQKYAKTFLKQGFHHMAMEVSSHGLTQHRVEALNFNVAVFTNLTHEHLDYHGDMETYFLAKKSLFLRPELKYAVINADDEYGQRLLKDPEIGAEKIAYSRQGKMDGIEAKYWILAKNEQFDRSGIQADIETSWGNGRIRSRLLGDFNLSNLLAVAGVLGATIGDMNKWLIGLNAAQPVVGRMQSFVQTDKPMVVVDYAHSPDALEKALKTLRSHCDGNIWCVFGCGGDRDTLKRPTMGTIAEKYADKVILTDDNPRSEDPQSIVDMIQDGFSSTSAPYMALRKEATEYAISNANSNDIILIAGKGHENYQEIAGEIILYSDIETVQSLLGVAQ